MNNQCIQYKRLIQEAKLLNIHYYRANGHAKAQIQRTDQNIRDETAYLTV